MVEDPSGEVTMSSGGVRSKVEGILRELLGLCAPDAPRVQGRVLARKFEVAHADIRDLLGQVGLTEEEESLCNGVAGTLRAADPKIKAGGKSEGANVAEDLLEEFFGD